jgi:hypothetical protein
LEIIADFNEKKASISVTKTDEYQAISDVNNVNFFDGAKKLKFDKKTVFFVTIVVV